MTPIAEVDLAGFADRASEWAAARAAYLEESGERADELAAEGRAAEQVRLAAEEAARLAEEERRVAEEAARREAARLAAVTTTTTTTAPATTTQPGPVATTPTPDAPAGSGPTPEQWEALRRCESAGNYSAVSGDGRFRGAYQFSQATWDWVAGFANPSLLGVDPAQASPVDQDALAFALWQIKGWTPWPTCSPAL